MFKVNGVPRNGDFKQVVDYAVRLNCNSLITYIESGKVEKLVCLVLNEKIKML